MSEQQDGEPTLAEVQAQYPQWACEHGASGLYYARNAAAGAWVSGEDPLDLRDQLKAAESRLACGLPVRGSC